MTRRKTLDIRTADGTLKTLIPASLTSIKAWQGGQDIAVCYHGMENYEVRLDPIETRQMIGEAWKNVKAQCPHYRQNACWWARQMYAPSAPHVDCIKCQLAQIYIQARQGDPRPLPTTKPHSPLCVAFWGSLGLMLGSWLIVQPYNVQARARFAAETELKREQARRHRAEAELVKLRAGVVTFRRQAKGDKRK